MSSFKQFRASKSPIVETTLKPVHQDETDTWDHHGELDSDTHEKIQKAFGSNDFVHFPLAHHEGSVDPDVGEHLANHGYDIKDYRAGLATKKIMVGNPDKGIPHREKIVQEKIGSILDKTAAPDHVKKAYMNDTSRTSFKSSIIGGGHHVVISTSPRAIGGMSTGTSWTSCMNMDTGCNNHYLPEDSKTGTHVAYLVNHNDPTAFKTGLPTNPVARISLKNHRSEDKTDTIFRPENSTYGNASTGFGHAVSSWATHNYPAKPDVTYKKHSSLYNDDGITSYKTISSKHVETALKNGESIYDNDAPHPLDHDVLDHAVHTTSEILKNTDTELKRAHLRNVLEIPNLNSNHIAKLRASVKNDTNYNSFSHLIGIRHGDKMSSNAIREIYSAEDAPRAPTKVLMNSKLPSEILDNIEPDSYHYVNRSLLKPHHYDKLVHTYNNDVYSHIKPQLHLDYMSSEHLDKLIDGNQHAKRDASGTSHAGYNICPARAIIDSKHFSQDHHNKLVNLCQRYKQANVDQDNLTANAVISNNKYSNINTLNALNLDTPFYHLKLMHNPHIDVETQKSLKTTMIDAAKRLPGPTQHISITQPHLNPDNTNAYYDRYKIGAYKFGGGQTHIPHNIGKHLTSDDYDVIAQKGKAPAFETAEHSAKLLNAYHKHALTVDSSLDNYLRNSKISSDAMGQEYDEHEDLTAKNLREHFHQHLSRYASALNEHLNNHASDESGYGIKSHMDHAIVGNHIAKINSLEHYHADDDNESNAEHYEEHFHDIETQHKDIEKHDRNLR